jgi:predicted aminopeptidase
MRWLSAFAKTDRAPPARHSRECGNPATLLRTFLIFASALMLGACSTIGYYAHLAHGELSLMSARKPIDKVVADPTTDSKLKAKLELAKRARAFASDHLGLPRNASYTRYADLHRAYSTWNVFATKEFSVEPLKQCFVFVGCIDYRGYYDRERADQESASLQAHGYETYVGGSAAYSTLGWFADPILNTMIRWGDDELIGTIFHELTHQKTYIEDDSAFNESLAMFVQQEGLRQWREIHGLPLADVTDQQRDNEFTTLVLQTRDRLKILYATNLPADEMRRRKQEEFARLRADYATLRDGKWHGDTGYDSWMNGDLNNAKLLPFGIYNTWVDAFAALYKKWGGDWPAFYSEAARIGQLDADARKAALRALQSE